MNQPNATTQAAQQSSASKIKSARISDYTRYDSRRCNNGGAYGFWTNYNYVGEGNYEITYGTTADFEFCEYCNSFGCHCDKVPAIATENEVWEEIKNAEVDPSPEVTAEYELFEIGEWIEKLRRRVRDALNKTTNEHAVISCAIALDCKLD